MYKGNIHAPKHAKLIYENATAPVFSLISNGGFSWNLNLTINFFSSITIWKKFFMWPSYFTWSSIYKLVLDKQPKRIKLNKSLQTNYRQVKTVFKQQGLGEVPSWTELTEYLDTMVPPPHYVEDDTGVCSPITLEFHCLKMFVSLCLVRVAKT